MKQEKYTLKNGEQIPFGQWQPIGRGFSIMLGRRVHKIRHDASGAISAPPGKYGPGNDALSMALYTGAFPESYARYCFGDVVEESV